MQPSDGLATAHAARIVHCDPKAGNILITREGRVKIPDFGLARTEAEFGSDDPTAKVMLTDPGTPLGTIAYMSPERHGERPISALSRISFRWVWCFSGGETGGCDPGGCAFGKFASSPVRGPGPRWRRTGDPAGPRVPRVQVCRGFHSGRRSDANVVVDGRFRVQFAGAAGPQIGTSHAVGGRRGKRYRFSGVDARRPDCPQRGGPRPDDLEVYAGWEVGVPGQFALR